MAHSQMEKESLRNSHPQGINIQKKIRFQKTENQKSATESMKHSEKNLADLYNNSDIALKQMFLGVNP